MSALTGNKIKDSYLGLLKSISNGAISSSFVQISDGGGNALPLYLSTSSIKFYDAYTFPSADGTVDGQVLSTDANGTLSWVTSSDNQTLQEVLTQGNTTSLEITTSAQFNGDINGALLQKVKAAEVLSKGDVVYISGGTGDNPEVSKANASDSTKMPALGIMKENLNNINDEGECITSGELTGVNLSSSGTIGDFDTGDELFVSSTTAGGLVDTAPTGEANLIQKIGKVIKGGNGGALTVLGAFRTNAMPNLPTGIILGDSTNIATAITDGSSGQILSTDGSGSYSFIDDNAITSAVSPLNLGSNQISLGTVPVTKGGTGATTLTGILLGNATSAISGITSANDGYVLTADGVGGYAFEGLPVKKTGTITVDELAVFDNADGTLRSDSTISIDSSGNITFDQGTNNYLIGGGNIAGNSGTGNVGLGHNVLTSQTSGNNNIAIGFGVLDAFVTGASNVAIGDNSMGASTGGTRNIAIGKNALQNGVGSYNLAIGDSSMSSGNLSGLQNTCVGYTSGNSLTSGGGNIFIGDGAGSSVTTVSNNVILGSNNGSTLTDNNNIIISDGGGNNRLQFASTGATTFSTNSNSSIINQFVNSDTTNASTRNTIELTAGNRFLQLQAYNADHIYFNRSSGSNLYFQSGGSTQMIISSGGNVGIGSAPITSPNGADTSLSVFAAQDSSIILGDSVETWEILCDDQLSFSYGSTPTRVMTLQRSTGNVGIGTTTPLTINGNAVAGSGLHVNAISGYGVSVLDGADGSQMFFNDRGASANSRLWRLLNNDGSFSINAMNDNISVKSSALTISSGGNVGIGTATMHQFLNIKSNSTSQSLINIATSDYSRTLNVGVVSSDGYVMMENAATLNIGTSGLPRLSISSGGLATFSNGIKFGGTPSPAYDSGADTLDAYEEGTWTPSITDSSNVAANLNSTNSVGVYTRIGNLVYFRATIQITSYPSPAPSSSSVAFIKGFPYTSATIPGNWYRPSSAITRYITFSGYLNLHINANSDYGYLFDSVSGSNGGSVEWSKYTDNSTISISGVYEI